MIPFRSFRTPAVALHAVGSLLAVVAAVACGGCQWMVDLGFVQNDQAATEELEAPAPLDEPFDDDVRLYRVSNARLAMALVDRLEEFAAGLENAGLRSAYAQSLAAGEPSRAKTYCRLPSERTENPEDVGRLIAAWDRIDDALAKANEPELVAERLYVVAAFVHERDPTGPSRLTEAIRDDWAPDAESWHEAIRAIEDPADPVWEVAWRAAQERKLGDVRGRAILEAMSWIDTPPTVHPFASPKNLEWLCERYATTRDEDELLHFSGQFRSLDPASSDRLFQGAQMRPMGKVRLHAAFEAYRRTRNETALAEMKASVSDEPLAVQAVERLSRCGQLDGIELPVGETLARAKAYFAVDHYQLFVDDEIRQTMLTPLVSGRASYQGEEFETSLFLYSMPAEMALDARGDGAGAEGFAIVDDGLPLYPDESSPAVELVDSAGPYPDLIAPAAPPSFQTAFDLETLATLSDQGCRTYLDLIAAGDLPDRRREYGIGFERNELLKQRLLEEDERWKVFDVPFDRPGSEVPAEGEPPAESVEPGVAQ